MDLNLEEEPYPASANQSKVLNKSNSNTSRYLKNNI